MTVDAAFTFILSAGVRAPGRGTGGLGRRAFQSDAMP
jgi:hypothetical protein